MIIKVCGMRRADNIRRVEQLGPDWMGFIFYPPSPRYVADVPTYLPQRCKRVGVFVNATIADMERRVADFHLDGIQLHGDETPHQCQQVRRAFPYCFVIKALRVQTPALPEQAAAFFDAADVLLFDAPCATYGGSGCTFDHRLLLSYPNSAPPFLLSGGLGPDTTISEALLSHPALLGLDVNSRFETAPGWKNPLRLAPFISRMRATHRPSHLLHVPTLSKP